MLLIVRLVLAFSWAMQIIFFFLPLALFFLHLVVGYAKPCWRDGDARISNAAAVCQYGRNDYYCCCYAFNVVKCQCCDMRRTYGLNINMSCSV